MDLAIQPAAGSALRRAIPTSFVLAVALLGGAALLLGPIGGRLNLVYAKAALSLKEPLAAIPPDALYPYRVVERMALDSVVVEALGTDQYINWYVEDAGVPTNDPLRFAHLFITYDTGGHNLVPHVPDECRLGAGYQPAQAHENLEVPVSRLPLDPPRVPVRVCTFIKTAVFDREQVSVVYTFFCNGQFVATRNAVRLLINHPTDQHAFFSKIEVSFPGATREESVKGAAKLFDRLLPVLIERHYPDFTAAESNAARGGEGA